jgi:hypothetical protein
MKYMSLKCTLSLYHKRENTSVFEPKQRAEIKDQTYSLSMLRKCMRNLTWQGDLPDSRPKLVPGRSCTRDPMRQNALARARYGFEFFRRRAVSGRDVELFDLPAGQSWCCATMWKRHSVLQPVSPQGSIRYHRSR